MSCSVGRRWGSDLGWLWLWHRVEAVALIQPLAGESPYAVGEAQKKKKKKKRQKTKDKKTQKSLEIISF